MNYRRTLIAGLVGVAALTLAAQDATPIQRVLLENSTETYKSVAKVDQTLKSPIGDFPITITSNTTYLLKTGKVDTTKGTAAVEMTSTIDSIDGGDSPLSSGLSNKKPGPIVQTGTIDKLGHLALEAPTGKQDATVNVFLGVTGGLESSIFVELPNHPVKVGDTWDIVVPKSTFTGDDDQKITAKLTGSQTVDGHDAWTVDLSGTINIKFDSGSVPVPQAGSDTLSKTHIIAKGVNTLKGTGTIDKATGKTLTLDTSGSMNTAIELPDEGVNAQGTGTITTSIKLQS